MPGCDPTTLLARLKTAKRLPSPPGIAIRVLELCRRPDTDVKAIAEVIMSDPALSGRLLRYANSAVVGVPREVTSVRDSVLLLGLRAVKLTALGFALATPEAHETCDKFDLKRFWAESYATGAVARRLAVTHFNTDREEAFTAGLLSGIGRLVLAYGFPGECAEIWATAGDRQSQAKLERERFGVDYAEIGAQLLADWGLPEVLVQSVGGQLCPQQANPQTRPLAQTINAASRLAPLFFSDADLPIEARQAARETIEQQLGLDSQRWQAMAEEVLTDYRQVSEVFDVQIEDQAAVFDLYAEAQEEATRVGMVAQLERSRALEENKELLRRATTDALTGAANRAKFEERLREAVAGLRRNQGHFALLMFDIDFFKRFNDTYGHDVGDRVLKEVVCEVQGALREVDLLARFGGEEFVVLAPHTDQRGACIIAARIRKCVEGLRIPLGGQELHVTVSVGLVLTTDYAEVPDVERLVTDVDKQLYLSKSTGRNTWSYLGRSAAQVMRVTSKA